MLSTYIKYLFQSADQHQKWCSNITGMWFKTGNFGDKNLNPGGIVSELYSLKKKLRSYFWQQYLVFLNIYSFVTCISTCILCLF